MMLLRSKRPLCSSPRCRMARYLADVCERRLATQQQQQRQKLPLLGLGWVFGGLKPRWTVARGRNKEIPGEERKAKPSDSSPSVVGHGVISSLFYARFFIPPKRASFVRHATWREWVSEWMTRSSIGNNNAESKAKQDGNIMLVCVCVCSNIPFSGVAFFASFALRP